MCVQIEYQHMYRDAANAHAIDLAGGARQLRNHKTNNVQGNVVYNIQHIAERSAIRLAWTIRQSPNGRRVVVDRSIV